MNLQVSPGIINAAPMVYNLGTSDKSIREIPVADDAVPTHCPKFYIYAEKGPIEPKLVSGAKAAVLYGTKTFDQTSLYYNHATEMLRTVLGNANNCVVERLIPSDAATGNLVLYIDVLACKVDDYQRDANGDITLDVNGDPTVLATQIDGHKIKWSVEHVSTEAALLLTYGLLPSKAGTMTDVVSSTTSTMYPIMQMVSDAPGAFSNNTAIRMWSPVARDGVDSSILTKDRIFPFFFSMVERADAASPALVKTNLLGSDRTMVALHPVAKVSYSNQRIPLVDVLASYTNTDNQLLPFRVPSLTKTFVYQDNIDLLLSQMLALEKTHAATGWDFTTTAPDTDKYLFNMITGVNFSGIPYKTINFVDSPTAFRFTKLTNVFAAGGTDGTIDDTTYDPAVSLRVREYLNADSKLMDTALNPESILYDSGFGLTTKLDLISAIALRKETFVVLGTYTVNPAKDNVGLTSDEDLSIALVLKTRLGLFPESDYFGTPVMRGLVISQSSKLLNTSFPNRVPLTFEVADKASKYMGAASGIWNSEQNMEGDPGNRLAISKEIKVDFIPAESRHIRWGAGFNWVQASDLKTFFFPSYKTVYTNDTSVLNSFCTAMAIVELNKIVDNMWRKFTGISSLTSAQLEAKIIDYINAAISNKFDGRFVIKPKPYVTYIDEARGYSLTLSVQIYANNMKTVLTTYIEAFRMSDLTTAA